jgi:hypothetical protein
MNMTSQPEKYGNTQSGVWSGTLEREATLILLRPARDGRGDKHRRGERLRVLTVFEFATRRNNEVWGE